MFLLRPRKRTPGENEWPLNSYIGHQWNDRRPAETPFRNIILILTMLMCKHTKCKEYENMGHSLTLMIVSCGHRVCDYNYSPVHVVSVVFTEAVTILVVVAALPWPGGRSFDRYPK